MASNAYIASSATVAGVAFAGLVRFTTTSSGQEGDVRCDAKQFQDVVPITNVGETITVEGKSVGINTAIVGTKGAFSLVGIQNTGGVTLSGNLTASGNCVISSIEKGFDIDGNSTIKVTADVYSSDGLTTGIGWA